MLASYIACGEPTKLLELFLSATSRGVVKSSSLPESAWPTHILPREDWRASTFDQKQFLPVIDVATCVKPLGHSLVMLWAAACAGQSVVISGKAAAHLALLTPLLAGFPTRNAHAYDAIFPCLSTSATAAVAAGATPTSVGQDGDNAQAELRSAVSNSKGRVIAVADDKQAAAMLSRRSWWHLAVDSDTGVISTSQGGGAGGATSDFSSPLHKAVWEFVQADIAALAALEPQEALWALATTWQAAGERFLVAPLRKLTQANGGQLTRATLNQPSLAPAAQEFLWQAAHMLTADGVEGVSLAADGVQGGAAVEEQ